MYPKFFKNAIINQSFDSAKQCSSVPIQQRLWKWFSDVQCQSSRLKLVNITLIGITEQKLDKTLRGRTKWHGQRLHHDPKRLAERCWEIERPAFALTHGLGRQSVRNLSVHCIDGEIWWDMVRWNSRTCCITIVTITQSFLVRTMSVNMLLSERSTLHLCFGRQSECWP